jgi:hypothetical protein
VPIRGKFVLAVDLRLATIDALASHAGPYIDMCNALTSVCVYTVTSAPVSSKYRYSSARGMGKQARDSKDCRGRRGGKGKENKEMTGENQKRSTGTLTALGAIVLHNKVLLQVRHINFLALFEFLEGTSHSQGVGVCPFATCLIAVAAVVGGGAARRGVVWFAVEGNLGALSRAGGGNRGETREGEEEAGCDSGVHFWFARPVKEWC